MMKDSRRLIHNPLATQDEIAREARPFPSVTAAAPVEESFPDWRERLTHNLSRRSDGRWDPLTYVHERPK